MVLTDVILESFRAVVLLVLVGYLWRLGKKKNFIVTTGWKFIQVGFLLVLFGSILDVTDNFEALNPYVVVGDTETEAFLEKVVGYLLGFIFLTIGLMRWGPTVEQLMGEIAERKKLEDALQKARFGLEEQIEKQTAELKRKIAEHQRIENALRESETLLRAFDGNSPSTTSVKDLQGRYMTSRLQEVDTEFYHEDVLGKTAYDLFSKEIADAITASDNEVLETGQTVEHEHEWEESDGVHTLLRVKFPIRDSAGEVKTIGTIGTDITARQRAEVALRESEERLRSIMDNSPLIIALKDAEGRYVTANKFSIEIFGLTEDEIIGKTAYDLFPKELADDIREEERKVFETRSAIEVETIMPTPNGLRPFLTVKFPVLGASGNPIGIGLISTDITERKKLDRMKDEFVSMVSHELRTPLTSIKGSLGLVVGGALGALPNKAKEMVDIAHRNAERLINLVNDILDIEKLESGRIEFQIQSLDLSDLVREAVETNKGFAEEHGVKFVFADFAPKVVVRGDSNRLTQVVANLLSNGAKFSPENGEVEISVVSQYGVATVSVSDHGPGIPEDFREKIFERFSQADASNTRKKGGTGLGLSITKSIIESHGGAIGFDSEVGVGSTFFFTLPISE
jgi:PAS domain S-box-containing protein